MRIQAARRQAHPSVCARKATRALCALCACVCVCVCALNASKCFKVLPAQPRTCFLLSYPLCWLYQSLCAANSALASTSSYPHARTWSVVKAKGTSRRTKRFSPVRCSGKKRETSENQDKSLMSCEIYPYFFVRLHRAPQLPRWLFHQACRHAAFCSTSRRRSSSYILRLVLILLITPVQSESTQMDSASS